MALLDVGVPKNLTATANIKSGQGQLRGFYVCSTSSGTIQLYDDPATGTTTPISGAITPAIGFHPFPAAFSNGLYVVIGATLNVTLFYA